MAGTSCAEVFDAGAGAAGGTGVCAVAGAGVTGALEEEGVLDALAGAAFGCLISVTLRSTPIMKELTLETMQTMKPFSSM